MVVTVAIVRKLESLDDGDQLAVDRILFVCEFVC